MKIYEYKYLGQRGGRREFRRRLSDSLDMPQLSEFARLFSEEMHEMKTHASYDEKEDYDEDGNLLQHLQPIKTKSSHEHQEHSRSKSASKSKSKSKSIKKRKHHKSKSNKMYDERKEKDKRPKHNRAKTVSGLSDLSDITITKTKGRHIVSIRKSKKKTKGKKDEHS